MIQEDGSCTILSDNGTRTSVVRPRESWRNAQLIGHHKTATYWTQQGVTIEWKLNQPPHIYKGP